MFFWVFCGFKLRNRAFLGDFLVFLGIFGCFGVFWVFGYLGCLPELCLGSFLGFGLVICAFCAFGCGFATFWVWCICGFGTAASPLDFLLGWIAVLGILVVLWFCDFVIFVILVEFCADSHCILGVFP